MIAHCCLDWISQMISDAEPFHVPTGDAHSLWKESVHFFTPFLDRIFFVVVVVVILCEYFIYSGYQDFIWFVEWKLLPHSFSCLSSLVCVSFAIPTNPFNLILIFYFIASAVVSDQWTMPVRLKSWSVLPLFSSMFFIVFHQNPDQLWIDSCLRCEIWIEL